MRFRIMKIRQMTIRDLDFVLNQTGREGWGNCRDDFEELIKHDSNSSFIGEIHGDPVGMVCVVNYGAFGFIGNLIIEPEYRGQNYGRLLMKHAMDYLLNRGAKSLFLDGVPKAISLYEKLGFKRIAKSLRLESSFKGKKTQNTRLMMEEDIKKINMIDSHHFGEEREDFLRMRFSKHPELSYVLECEDEVIGFIMGRYNIQGALRIGPWVMDRPISKAEDLLFAITSEPVVELSKIGVLETSTSALDVLKKNGFKETSFSWRMLYGNETEATLSNHLYAICGADRG